MSGKMIQSKKQTDASGVRRTSHAATQGVAAFLRSRSVRLLAAAAAMALPVGAAHAGGPIQVANVASGVAAFAQAGNVTTITAANNTIINYQKFGVPQGHTVDFIQPSAAARVLNRIIGPTPTQIDGTLNANGVVYFVNPAGVMFGAGAVINVGQLYAAAGHMSDGDFLSGVNSFTDNTGSITNAGVIKAGDVTFAAGNISNNGTILTPDGMVVMAAGKDVYVSKLGSPFLVQVAGTSAAKASGTQVSNSGNIDAAGGDVAIRAGDMYSLAINTSGTIKAANISLQADGTSSTLLVSGKVDAANQGTDSSGGTITVNGGRIGIGVSADAAGNYHNASATLSAGGANGGGKILIGVKPDAASATGYSDSSTYDFIGAEAVLNASSTGRGNGGLVDTSGQVLNVSRGAVIRAAGAGGGEAGQWLLDPASVTITSSTSTATAGYWNAATPPHGTFEPLATSSGAYTTAGTADTGTIDAALQAGDNVTISTANGSTSGTGNITVSSALSPIMTSNVTLTLNAANGIDIEAGIAPASGNGALAVALNAGGNLTTGSGAGSAIYVNGAINTNGGNFSATAAGSPSLLITLNQALTGTNGVSNNGGAVSISSSGMVSVKPTGSINVGGSNSGSQGGGNAGSITISGVMGVTVDGNLTATGGDSSASGSTGGPGGGILVTSSAGNVSLGAVTLGTAGGNDSAVSTSGGGGGGVGIDATGAGTITLTNTTINTSATDDAGAGAVAIYSSSGAITLTGVTIDAGGNVPVGETGGSGGAIGINTTANVIFDGVNTFTSTGTGSSGGGGGGISGTASSLTAGGGAGSGGGGNGGGASTSLSPPNSANGSSGTGGVSGGGSPGVAGALTITGGGTVTVNGPLDGAVGTLSVATAAANLNAMLTGLTDSSISGSGISIVTIGSSGSYVGDIQAGIELLPSVGGGILNLNAVTVPEAITFYRSLTLNAPTTGSVEANSWSSNNSATVTLSGNLKASTASGFVFNGPVVVAAGGADLTNAVPAPITFASTLNGTTGSLNGIALVTAGGTLTFGGAVGQTVALASIDQVGNGPVSLDGGTVVTSGDQTFNGSVTLGTNNQLTANSNNSSTGTPATVMFGSTVAGGGFNLTIGNPTGPALSDAVFGGTVSSVATLDVTGTASIGGSITTSGAQTYSGAVTLNASPITLTANSSGTAEAITFGNTVDGADALNIGTAGSATASDAVFDGRVGGTASLTALEVSGTTLLVGNVTTTTGQTYSGAVTLATGTVTLTGTTLNAASAGAVFNGTATTLNLGFSSSANLGAMTALGTLDGTGTGAYTLNGDITTAGAQTYGGAVTLAASLITLTATSPAQTITFQSTVDGLGTLSIGAAGLTSNAVFAGNVGGTIGLVSLNVTGTTLLGGNVTTTGVQNFTGPVTLNTGTQLVANSTDTSSGIASTVTFGSTLGGGGFSLTVGNATGPVLSNAVFAGAVNSVAALTVTGATSLSANVTTTAGQTYSGVLTLGANTNLTDSSSAGILFGSAISGTGKNFTVLENAATGPVTFDGALPGTGTLGNVNITAGGQITFGSGVNLIAANSLSLDSTHDNSANAIAFSGATLIAANTQSYTAAAGSVVLSLAEFINASRNGLPTSLTVSQGASIFDSSLPSLSDFLTALGTPATSLAGMGVQLSSTVGSITISGAEFTGASLSLNGNTGVTLTNTTELLLNSLAVTGNTTLDGAVFTGQGQTYNSPVTLANSFTLADTGSGTITFASTISGAESLAVEASIIDFQGNTGYGAGLIPLISLAVSGYSAGGPTSSGTTTLGTAAGGGAVETSGNQTWANAVTLDHAASLVSTGTTGSVVFGSTVNGAKALIVEADNTAFQANVGSSTALLSVSAGGYSAGGPAADGTTTLGGNVTTTDGQTYANPLTLAASDVVLSDTGGGNITLASVSGAGDSLAVTVSGTGAIIATGAINTAGASGSAGGYATPGSAGRNGGSITLTAAGGSVSVSNVVTSGGNGGNGGNGSFIFLVPGGNGGNGGNAGVVSISTTSGAVTVGDIAANGGGGGTGGFGAPSGVNGTAGANGAISIVAAPGGITLNTGGAALAISGAAETFNGAVTLDSDTTMTGSTLNSGAASGLTIAAGNGHSLTLDVTSSGNLGAMTALSSLSANGGIPYALNGSIGASGTQLFSGPVVLNAAGITLTGSIVTFNSTVNSAVNAANPLTISGDVVFSNAVGSAANGQLGRLSVSGTTSLGGSVDSGGSTQTYGGTATLNATGLTLTGQTVTFNGIDSVDSAANAGNTLTIVGNAAFGGAVGGASNGQVGALSVSGTTTLGGNVTTASINGSTGNQIYDGAVTLAADTVLNGVALAGPVAGVSFSGPNALTLNFTGSANLGTISTLGSLVSNGLGSTTLYGDISTSGAQSYSGTVSLAAAAITLAGTTLNSSSTPAVFSGSGDALTLAFSSNANLGTISTLGSLVSNGLGATTLYGDITTSGAQSYNGAVALAATPIMLTGTTLNSSSTPAVFSGSGDTLTLDFSSSANLGTISNLGSLASNGPGTTTLYGDITTSGVQSYNGTVALAATPITLTGTTLNSSSAPAVFSGSGDTLTLDFSSSANLGTISTLGSLVSNGPGATTLYGDITTSGTQSYNGAVALAATPITLTGTTLNSSSTPAVFSGSGDALTLAFSGNANLGTISTLGSLVSNGPGATTLYGDITTSGTQSYNGFVALAATPITLTGTTLNSSSTPAIFSGSGDALTLAFSSSANLGTISTLGSLVSNGPVATTLFGDITTSGVQSYNGTVSLAAASITLTGTTLNSSSTPAIFSGSGDALTLAFSSSANLGTISTLGSLVSNGPVATTLFGDITTSGVQSYNGTVSLAAASITLTGTTLNSSSTPAVFSGSGDALTLAFSSSANLETISTLGSLVSNGLGATTLYGDITTSGVQSYNGTVSLAAASITLTGTTLNSSSTPAIFSGSGDTLTLHFSSSANLGVITTLGSLADTGSGTTTLNGNITTGGNQSYSTPVGINSALTLTGASLNPSPSAAAVFIGAGTPSLILDFTQSYNVNLGASGGLASLDLGVPSTVPVRILTSTALSYPLAVTGTVTVGQNSDPAGSVITLTGSSFKFGSSFDAASPNDAVIFAALGGTASSVEFDGVVGGSSTNPDLASLAVQETATVNGGAVNTINDQIYTGAVRINNNGTTTLTSVQGGIAEDGGISSTGSITLSPNSALMVPNPDPILGAGATTGDFRPQNYLTINGNITAAGTVALAPNAPTYNGTSNPIPDAATIITTLQSGTVAVTGQNIYMGMGQKWTSLTGLSLSAIGGTVELGDVNVVGTIAVNAGTIDMLLRPAGSQLVPGISSGVLGLHINTPGSEGVDIVANTINLTGRIVPVGAGADYAPQYAYGPGGTVTGSITPISSGVHFYGVNVLPSTLLASGIANGRLTTYYLDLKASGPSVSNVTVAVTPIIPPPPPQFNSVVVLSSEQRQILREAGINARNTSIDNLLNLVGGKAVFNDIPTSDGMIIVHPTLLDYYVTTSRLPYQQTRDFIALYRDVFLAPVINPKTHQSELDKKGNVIYRSKRTELHVLFRNSFSDYSKVVGAAHATALGFRLWLEKTPSQLKALQTLNQLRALLGQARGLGLTSVELRLSHSTILAELNPQALSERQFEETVLGRKLSNL